MQQGASQVNNRKALCWEVRQCSILEYEIHLPHDYVEGNEMLLTQQIL